VNSKPLPCRPPPIEDELLSSWITRLAHANHCSVEEFCGYLGFEQGRVPETVAELENGNLDHLSFLVQLPASEVAAMTLPDGIRFEVQYVSQHDFHKCAVCTSQTPGLILRHWRFVWATACEKCGRALVALCPADNKIVPEKLICRANRGAEVLRSAFYDGDLRLGRRLGRAFYMLRSRDLAQSASLTSGDKRIRFSMLAAIGTRVSHTLLTAAPGFGSNAALARHLSRVFPQHREVIARMVALSEVSDENSTVCANNGAPPQYRAATTSVEKVSEKALSAARQAIAELGSAADQHKLLVRAEEIWAAIKEQSGLAEHRP
tara:strand:+ start:2634 stop:3593 length:960 start_codon:yes stop_codon:yes gene_type:complete